MVLGLRSKHRKDNSVQVDYQVHVKEIKPWPPSQTLRSVQSVLLQWENGDQSSGYLSSSVGNGNGNIEFNNSFALSITLCREKRARDSFQKNCLEFYLYEPRKDKSAKGQLLGTAVINLADYGIINENLTISVPLNSKKSSKNTAQPVLFVSVQPFDKESSNSSPKSSISKEADKDVSELMNGENDDESEIASFTDDDESSHSLKTISSSAFETTKSSPKNDESGSESLNNRTGRGSGEPPLPFGVGPTNSIVNLEAESLEKPTISSHQPSLTILSPDLESSVKNQPSLVSVPKNSVTQVLESASSSAYKKTNDESDSYIRSSKQEVLVRDFYEEVSDGNGKIKGNAQKPVTYVDKNAAIVASLDTHANVKSDSDKSEESHSNGEDFGQASRWSKNGHLEKKEERENEEEENFVEEKLRPSENNLSVKVSQDFRRSHGALRSETLTLSRRAIGMQGTATTNSKLKHVKSVMLPFDSSKDNRFHGNNHSREGFVDRETEWKSRVEILEEELREAAVLEAALYSIVAEHGGSTNKVHAPARRLSRFYLHACKARSGAKKANAAGAVVSGLVLVSKACGNDVPRLAFWLSNSIMLRGILNQSVADTSLSYGTHKERNGGGKHLSGKSLLKGDKPFSTGKEKNHSTEEFDDWEDPQTFAVALEKVESWIFSRIVESIWWQTLTPHMQSTAAKTSGRANGSSSKKTYGGRSVMGDQDQGNFSVEHWNKAFKDACERLCPIRAGGHECGCLPVMARLVMEQLVSRLDVAMFNAILRESDDEMPTDPVSDPISDSKVLPIPAGKSSFGAGAQLKNAVGNWSLWLADLFGTEDNDILEGTNVDNENGPAFDTSFKAFPLLNALSDLMMLPFEMVADRSTRKEVCPTFGVPLITRVLENFIPDEFCPDPVPMTVLEALDAEDVLETSGESFTSFPCTASPTVYSPPPPASLARIIGEIGTQSLQRSGSSLLRKSYTSDDELDELDSPITSIIIDGSRVSPTSKSPNWIPKGKGGRNVVRYQLLREVWKDGE